MVSQDAVGTHRQFGEEVTGTHVPDEMAGVRGAHGRT